MREGNDNMYCLDCEHESLNTVLLGVHPVLGTVQGTGVTTRSRLPCLFEAYIIVRERDRK